MTDYRMADFMREYEDDVDIFTLARMAWEKFHRYPTEEEWNRSFGEMEKIPHSLVDYRKDEVEYETEEEYSSRRSSEDFGTTFFDRHPTLAIFPEHYRLRK
jgi:hypothetical protein